MAKTEREAAHAFRGLGTNFMTPNIIEYGWAGDLAYELASEFPGAIWEDIVEKEQNPQPHYGVTFRNADGSMPDPNPSTGGLKDEAEARTLIADVTEAREGN